MTDSATKNSASRTRPGSTGLKRPAAPATRQASAQPRATPRNDALSNASAPTTTPLDRVDRAILRQLQRDASISNVALAAKVNLSAPACLRRVERLKETGYIRGMVALLEPTLLDAGMMVMIGVVLDRSTPESFADFEKAAQKISGCMECHFVTGEFDCFLMIRTRDSESFKKLHAEQLLYLPGVRQIRTFMVLKEVLSTTHLPV